VKGKVAKLICAGTATLFILAGLIPPWTLKLDAGSELRSERSVGFHAIFSPPEIQSLQKRFYPQFNDKSLNFLSVRIDNTRLLIEWACILTGGIAAWVITMPKGAKGQQREQDAPSVTKTPSSAARVERRIPANPKSERSNLPDSVQSRLYVRMNEYLKDNFPNSDRGTASEYLYPKLLEKASRHATSHGNLDDFSVHSALKEESEAWRSELARRRFERAAESTSPTKSQGNE
jgi:hypothetical protein